MSKSNAHASGGLALALARISFFVLAAVAFVSVLGLFDAMLETDYAIYDYLAGINTVVLITVLSLIALVGLSGSLSVATETARHGAGRSELGLHLKLTEPVLTGRDVERVQAMLHVLQFPILIDGQYGPEAAASVRSFQSSMGLTPNGVVDENTLAALESQVAAYDRTQWVTQILAQNEAVPAARTDLPAAAMAGAD